MAENKKVTFFTDEKGLPSSTRLTGFITSLSLIAVVIMNIIYRSDWKLALVSDAVLAGVTIGCYQVDDPPKIAGRYTANGRPGSKRVLHIKGVN